ncbi:hypothetical protein EBZ38_13805 [bacterium]|nr:hypothetical protein [bacterium]NDC94957.1 hypothetical protein [bacterium]NDD85333.1 hypothetical protein [bacterium]
MNFTESFQEFSSRTTPTDLALYAGVGLIVWVLFKDKLSPVTNLFNTVVSQIKKLISANTVALPVVSVPKVDPVVVPKTDNLNKDDVFFKLVVSWKQTRDLAEKSGCSEAVKVADQMFPFLSPNVCSKKEDRVV